MADIPRNKLVLASLAGLFTCVHINVHLISENCRREVSGGIFLHFIHYIFQHDTHEVTQYVWNRSLAHPCVVCCAISSKVPFQLSFRLLVGQRVPMLRGYITTSWFGVCLSACRLFESKICVLVESSWMKNINQRGQEAFKTRKKTAQQPNNSTLMPVWFLSIYMGIYSSAAMLRAGEKKNINTVP